MKLTKKTQKIFIHFLKESADLGQKIGRAELKFEQSGSDAAKEHLERLQRNLENFLSQLKDRVESDTNW